MKASPIGRRLLQVAMLVTLAVLVASLGVAAAGEWKPTKPIQFIVPYAPGGGSDVLARSIGQVIQGAKLNPTPLIVVNQGGGSGTVGTNTVAQSPGNEHMLLTFISGQVAGPLVAGKGANTYKDLTLIGNLAIDEQLIVVKWDSPYKTMQDVVAAAKQKPGTITIGGTATGQEDQMCNRLVERSAGITFRYIPFNSGGEVITALLGGHTELSWANPSEFFPQWEAKLVRPLAVAKETRLPKFPDAPTFKETGYDVTFKMFRGIAAPPGISPAVAGYYENMMKRMAESTAWKEKYLDQYMLSPNWMSSKEFAAFVAQNEVHFKALLIELGLLK
jgi:putative tricarboxylic transport membrane protein